MHSAHQRGETPIPLTVSFVTVKPAWGHSTTLTTLRRHHTTVKVCARVGLYPVSVDLHKKEFLWGRGLLWIVHLLPFPICGIRRLISPSPSLRSASCRLWRLCGFVSAWSVLFPLSFYAHRSLPSLRAPVPPFSLICPYLLCIFFLRRLMIVPSGMGRDIGTLPHILEGHTGASGLAAVASRVCARQRGPSFAAGVNARTSRLCWCPGVSCQHRPLLLQSVSPLNLYWSNCQTGLFIFVFDSLYC